MRELVALAIKSCSSDLEFALEDTEEHVVRKRVPTRRAVFRRRKPPTMIINHQPPRWQAGTTMRAERECRAMSEPIGRHSCPGVPLHCDAATSHRIHIFSLHTTDICNIWRSQAPRSTISIPSHTIVRRLGLLSDWQYMKWAKSGTLRTISEYRRVHDQTTCSNGRNQRRELFVSY